MFGLCCHRFFAVLALLGLIAGDIATQNTAFGQTQGSEVQNVFLPAPRELRQHITRAKEAVDEGRLSEAVNELGTLLVSPNAEDYFIGAASGAGTQTSLKVEAQRLLGTLPPRALETYELVFGSDARKLLNEALEAGDVQKLTNVTRMYFHTDAGYEATMLLGRHHLDQSRPLAAALCFQRVLESPAGKTYDPALSIMLATCWLYAHREENAKDILVQLKKRNSDPIDAGGVKQKFFSRDEDPVEWLTKLTGKRASGQTTSTPEWLVFRGDNARNGQSGGGLPLPDLRWRVPTVNDPTDEEIVKELDSVYKTSKTAAIPSLHPLAVRDTVLMRSHDRLIAVDFKNGKRIWEWPWEHDSAYQQAYKSTPNLSTNGQQVSPRRKELQQRIWDDAPHGQLASDGESVFLLDELGVASPTGYPVNIRFGGLRVPNDRFRQHNKLVALSLAREGALLWRVGGAQGDSDNDEPRLSGAFFLGAPLALMGQLFALAEINSEIRLVALDRKSGELKWSQQIAQVESNPIIFDGPRRLAGASPSFADGVLVCPTSSGAIVAVDTTTRSLLWGFQYPRAVVYYNRGLGRVAARDNRLYGSRWMDATVTIADGHVVFTPVESNEMYCLDLLTGKPVWKEGKKRDNLLYVACVNSGNAVMVGKNEVTALQLKDGEQAWSIPLGGDVRPSGRGFFSNNHYFLPTTDSKILKIDVEGGEVVSSVETDYALGNLICYKGEVISHGPDWLTTFPQDQPLRVNVRERLKKDANDVWALSRQAELQMRDGERKEALATVRRAYELDPKNNDTRAVLADALLAVVREDFLTHREIADELEDIVERPSQKAELLRYKALGYLKLGDPTAAFTAFVGLAGINVDGEKSKVRELPMETVERHLNIRHDRWVTAQLGALYGKLEADNAATIDKQINNLLASALEDRDIRVLRRFLEFFGFHSSAGQARMALLESLIAEDDLLQAERVALDLMNDTNTDSSRAASALYADLLAKSGKINEAASQYRQIAKQWKDTIVHKGKTGQQLLEEVSKQAQLTQAFKTSNEWLYGEPEISEGGRTVGNSPGYNRITPIDIRQLDGAPPEGLRILYDRMNSIVIRNGHGKHLLTVSLNRTDGTRRYYTSSYAIVHGKVRGHLLVVSLGLELVAIDMLSKVSNPTEAILWRHDLIPTVPDALKQNTTTLRAGTKTVDNPWGAIRYQALDPSQRPIGSMSSISENGLCFMRQNELVCVEPLTGKTLWIRGGFDAGSEVFGDEELVFVVGPNAEEAQTVRLVDGKMLGSRPIAASATRWTSNGRNVLSWTQNDQTLTLQITDIWAQKVLCKHDVLFGARACLMENEEVAVLGNNGQLTVLSIRDGVKRFDAKLNEEKSLTNLYALRSADQYLVVTNSPSSANSNVTIQSAPVGIYSPLISGKLYAFDRATGKMQWDKPNQIDRFGFPLDQATEVPTLTFLRHETPNSKSGPRTLQSSILMFDRRDGRQILAKRDIPARTDTYQIEGTPSQQLVSVRLPGKVLKIKFTEKPIVAKPQPEENTGASNKTNSNDSQVSAADVERFRQLQNTIETQEAQLRQAIEEQAAKRSRE